MPQETEYFKGRRDFFQEISPFAAAKSEKGADKCGCGLFRPSEKGINGGFDCFRRPECRTDREQP